MVRRGLSLAQRVEDEVRFFKTWATNPLKMGAISPTSDALADAMVRHSRPDPEGFALELGPGTGVVTQALLRAGVPAGRIVCVEFDKGFCRLLRERFPGLHVIRGDALDLDRTLGSFRDVRFSTVLSAVPLLSMPKPERTAYLEDLLDRLAPGGVVTQLSYALTPPQEPIPGRIAVEKSKWVTFNLPPGRVWIYRRP